MKLFKIYNNFQKTPSNPLIYPTPIGDIHFDIVLNGKHVEKFPSVETMLFKNGIVSAWEIEGCRIEFLQVPFKPEIPSSMQVESCIAGIWRIKSFSNTLVPIFKTTLNSNLLKHGIPESGEGLAAITFEHADLKLSIGTEDEDYLNNRASINKWMPHHFLKKIFPEAIKFLPNGLEIVLPSLKTQDYLQVQFVIAWSSTSHLDSCWFAVEQSAEHIFKEAGIEI